MALTIVFMMIWTGCDHNIHEAPLQQETAVADPAPSTTKKSDKKVKVAEQQRSTEPSQRYDGNVPQ